MNKKEFCGIIGDCADDLLGGGNAVSVKNAAKVLDMLEDMTFTMKLYIKQCCTEGVKIADHNADKKLLKRVRKFAYKEE